MTDANRITGRIAITLGAMLVTGSTASAQTWTQLRHNAPAVVGYTALLTDGTVLAHEETFATDNSDTNWFKLTPDASGSYANGTWSQIAAMPPSFAPIDFASAVLPDGRFVVIGGEWLHGTEQFTNQAAIYDPIANRWMTFQAPPGWNLIGDGPATILPNGRLMVGQSGSATKANAILDPRTLTWTFTGANKFDANAEEGWTLLPDGRILTVDCFFGQYDPNGTASEIYDPATGAWSSAGSTRRQLWDSAAACGGASQASFEIGPGVLMPNGTVFVTGGNRCGAAHTAIFDTKTNTWSAGPDFPNGLGMADAPAAVETNGKVLMMTSPGVFQNGAVFFEWDGRVLTEVAAPSTAVNDSSFFGKMLELPNGQILFTDYSANAWVWTPAGTFDNAWRPTISSVPTTLSAGGTFTVRGTQFNGLTQGAYYGDDAQEATNWPLVRITNNATGHIFYARTHDHSSMGVATGSLAVSTRFDVPRSIESGASRLVVVANGIPSRSVAVTIGGGEQMPSATLAPASLAFGTVNVGTTSAAQSATLRNAGPGTLAITSILTSGDFTQTNNCGTSVASGGTCTISVRFSPTAGGTRAGTLTVTSNAANGALTTNLSGTGTGAADNINFSGTAANQGAFSFTPNFTSRAGTITATLNAPAGTTWRFVLDNVSSNVVQAEMNGAGPLTITVNNAPAAMYNFFVQATTGSGSWTVTGSHP